MSDITRAADRLAAEADRLSAAFARDLAAVWSDVERRVRTLISDDTPPARRLRSAIRKSFEQAGFDRLAEAALDGPLDAITERVLAVRAAGGTGTALANAAVLRLDALRAIYLDDLLQEGDVVTRAVNQAVLRGTFGNKPVRKLVDDVARQLDLADGRVRTLYDTSVSIYGRQVEAVAAGDDPETRFAFIGPVDRKTRDFCKQHVGKVYTRAEIDALDNGQIDNVFLTGGGYNCRHVWTEIAKSSELWDLAGTDGRVPELAEDLRQAS